MRFPCNSEPPNSQPIWRFSPTQPPPRHPGNPARPLSALTGEKLKLPSRLLSLAIEPRPLIDGSRLSARVPADLLGRVPSDCGAAAALESHFSRRFPSTDGLDARFLKRFQMIPYSACVCRGADRRRWTLLTAQEGTSLTIGNEESFCISYPGEDEKSLSSAFSTSEICMLEAVKKADRCLVTCAEQEVRLAGRRSRQPVITRILDLSLLDDTYSGITKILLSKCNNWAFNTFNLDVSTGGRSLSYLLVHLFQEYGFVQHFKLDIVKVWHCFNLMEAAYHRHNPYHNSVHAADVTQAMHCFLQENKFATYLTPLEAMSAVIAAVAHDLDHPGVTQAFLVATSNHLVNLYHNSSVLENHHWRTAISCLSESGIFNHLDKEVWSDIQMKIRSLILATDITRQKEFLARFKDYLSTESLDMEQTQYRHFALQIALKCADLCNPCRPWAISQRWSYQVCQEFYRQGAYERQLKLPVTPTFDCSRTKVAKIQTDFFQFVVSPLFETWDNFLNTPLSNKLLINLQHNFAQWQQRMITVQQAVITESKIPEITIDSSLDSSKANQLSEKNIAGKESLLTVDSDVLLKQHRSKSDSSFTPGLLSPKIHMETYSTEELHPSTTLLSLSSITNTVQLRQVYATTKVESHLICPTLFQPSTNVVFKEKTEELSLPITKQCEESCSNETNENNSDNNVVAQCSVNVSCPDGCGTPTTPEKSPTLHVHSTKQRSQSLINDSDELKHCSRILQHRRASDFDFYMYNNVYGASGSTSPVSDKGELFELQHSREKYFTSISTSTDNISNRSPSIDSKARNSFCLPNICSNKECLKGTCVCRTDSDNKTPSWCWHISRSFSAERPVKPTHDFDSPLPSGHGSSSSLNYNGHNRRRGSAPVTYSLNKDSSTGRISSVEDLQCKDSQKEGSEICGSSGRRWSIPVAISGFQETQSSIRHSEKSGPTLFNTRRRSFGLLEPLLAATTMDEEHYSQQNCSTVKSFQTSQFSNNDTNDCSNETRDKSVASSDPFLTITSQQRSSQRRGSLPTDLYSSGEMNFPLKESSEVTNQPRILLEQTRRHGAPADLLSVLIGPSGMLNTMHGIINSQRISEGPCNIAQGSSRRRSGGLEMLSGIWRPRTSDIYIGIGMASKWNLRCQLLEAWSSWRMEENKLNPQATTSTTSVIDPHLKYLQRRGSVPLNMSLLSMKPETAFSSGQDD
ncbi:hypothetical protein JTE90_010401 [Oedothorax gibbosus]|uniref:Phosphodiesterase n=1 Tax=Oedothorax gibbosus TaxID=931172 RepID=A0AAV6W5I5_9ARAC|nr:hypothetical protein JTE90_010401 [Oedothorax gibbosus]